MPIFKLLVAGVFSGVVANVTGYLITGHTFHRYQAMTPNTWRGAESWAHYVYAMTLRLFTCTAIGFMYCLVGAKSPFFHLDPVMRGAIFGGILWAVTMLPVVLELALFVNWHRGGSRWHVVPAPA